MIDKQVAAADRLDGTIAAVSAAVSPLLTAITRSFDAPRLACACALRP